ncbi:MAG: hypothetical protein GXO22_07305 [Aquificae bacterium]|nr:hypothetical protein [Aquificota bacterium]
MQITKQDIQILLLGGGKVESVKNDLRLEDNQPVLAVEKAQYPRLVRIMSSSFFYVGFSREQKIPAGIFISNRESIGFELASNIYQIPLHKGQELYLSSNYAIIRSLVVFNIDENVLKAPNSRLEIENTFNIVEDK